MQEPEKSDSICKVNLFLNNELEIYISFCKRIGFEYIYITTNGVYATADKIEKLCKAGLSSIKFSINSATKETYKKIHGRDNFDIVIKNFYEIINKKCDPIYDNLSPFISGICSYMEKACDPQERIAVLRIFLLP